MKWNYESKLPKSSGYEEHIDILKYYNRKRYLESSDEDKLKMIDEVFKIYRSVNILPIQYYNEDGVREEIRKCIEKEVSFDGDTLDLKLNQGGSLCRFLFPNLANVQVAGDKRTISYKFESDHNLKRAIEFCLKHKKSKSPVTPSGIKDGLEMLGGNVATNFKPMNAKALIEYYTPEGGNFFDFSCGFGGRMLGCLSSKKNFTYYGVEPNTDTYKNLLMLGKAIESVTGRENSFKILCQGSEDIEVKNEGTVDFSFSSPPYFNLEAYCQEDTQCYLKFPDIEDWYEGYVRPTIKNIFKMTRTGGKYAVNIADFKVGSNKVSFVDRWLRISEEEGFTFEKYISMKLQARRGVGHTENERSKQEGIYVFSKVFDNE